MTNMAGRALSFAFLALGFASVCVPLPAQGAEFTEELERVIPLRSGGELQITNNRGDISIEGWTQDRVRLRIKRRAEAETPEEARRLFGTMDIRHRTTSGDIEVSAEYGHGLTLQERLRERKSPKSSMILNMLAPSHLRLRVWAVNGEVSVRGWRGNLEIRSVEGPIHVENAKGDHISIMCPSCDVRVAGIQAKSLRVMGGAGAVHLKDVKVSHSYIETEGGSINSEKLHGEQLFVSRTGAIGLRNSTGHIGFHSQHGAVEVLDGAGYLSGKTISGNISARMKRWEFEDKAIVESSSGDVFVALPSRFSGEFDLWSGSGKLSVDFPLRKEDDRPSVPVAGRLLGVAGEGGDILRVHSEKGAVRISTWK